VRAVILATAAKNKQVQSALVGGLLPQGDVDLAAPAAASRWASNAIPLIFRGALDRRHPPGASIDGRRLPRVQCAAGHTRRWSNLSTRKAPRPTANDEKRGAISRRAGHASIAVFVDRIAPVLDQAGIPVAWNYGWRPPGIPTAFGAAVGPRHDGVDGRGWCVNLYTLLSIKSDACVSNTADIQGNRRGMNLSANPSARTSRPPDAADLSVVTCLA